MKSLVPYLWLTILFSFGLAVSCGPKNRKPKINTDVSQTVVLGKVNSCAAAHSEVREYQRITGKLNVCISDDDEPEIREINYRYLFKTLDEQKIAIKLPIALTAEGASEESLMKANSFIKDSENPCLDQIERIFSVNGLQLEILVDPSNENVNNIELVDRTDTDGDLSFTIKNAYHPYLMIPEGTSQCREACEAEDEACPRNCAIEASQPFCQGLLGQVGHHLGISDTSENNLCLTEAQRASAPSGSIFVGAFNDEEDVSGFWNTRRLSAVQTLTIVTPICEAGEASSQRDEAEEE